MVPQGQCPHGVAEPGKHSAEHSLCAGLAPVAAFEAKRSNLNMTGKIDHAERYSWGRPCPGPGVREEVGWFSELFAYSSHRRLMALDKLNLAGAISWAVDLNGLKLLRRGSGRSKCRDMTPRTRAEGVHDDSK